MVFVNSRYAEVEVWVEVGGERVEEFQASQLDDTTQTCYIPSKTGEQFAMCFKASSQSSRSRRSRDMLHVRAYADGVSLVNRVIDWHRGSTYSEKFDSVRDSASTRRLLEFGSLLLTDDESVPRGTERTENIGELRFEVRLVKKIRSYVSSAGYRKPSMPGDDPLHETNKKAVSHAVKLGDTLQCKEKTGYSYSVEDIPGTLAYKVYFKYASIDHLRAQGMVPRPASPTPVVPPQEEEIPKSEANPTRKHKSDSEPQVKTDPLSDDSLDNLTREEKEIFARLKKKAQEGRKSKKPKLEHQDSTAGEIIILSD